MHIALLRAVNVGGNNAVKMSELCEMFGDLGFADAKSLLASGNVVFDAGKRDSKKVEAMLEDATAKRFGIQIDYMVRTSAEWKQLVAKNPFAAEAKKIPQ